MICIQSIVPLVLVLIELGKVITSWKYGFSHFGVNLVLVTFMPVEIRSELMLLLDTSLAVGD